MKYLILIIVALLLFSFASAKDTQFVDDNNNPYIPPTQDIFPPSNDNLGWLQNAGDVDYYFVYGPQDGSNLVCGVIPTDEILPPGQQEFFTPIIVLGVGNTTILTFGS